MTGQGAKPTFWKHLLLCSQITTFIIKFMNQHDVAYIIIFNCFSQRVWMAKGFGAALTLFLINQNNTNSEC